MTELLLLALGASLVNNFVLSNFLGLCPFIGVSRRFEAAAGMALATLFVLTLASGLSFALWQWVLVPLGLEYLRTLSFIVTTWLSTGTSSRLCTNLPKPPRATTRLKKRSDSARTKLSAVTGVVGAGLSTAKHAGAISIRAHNGAWKIFMVELQFNRCVGL